jgi:hypothetical protein
MVVLPPKGCFREDCSLHYRECSLSCLQRLVVLHERRKRGDLLYA